MSTPQGKAAGGGAAAYLLGLILLVAGAGLSAWWLLNPTKAQRRRHPQHATLVETQQIELATERIVVDAMGTVVPVREMRLAARIGGRICELAPSFAPGGRFEAGARIAKLDPADAKLAIEAAQAEVQRRAAELEGKQSDVAQCTLDVQLAAIAIERAQSALDRVESQAIGAESKLSIEMGLQTVAETDYQSVPRNVGSEERDLMLRRPQLRAAKAECEAAKAARSVARADLKAAEAAKRTAEERKQAAVAVAHAAEAALASVRAALKKARLDSERTTIQAPFNAIVLAKRIDLGSQVAVGSELASLVGTDAFWIRISVPVDQLQWIDIPGFNSEHGAEVDVSHASAWGPESTRSGRVQQLMTDLEPEGRMARLLVVVEDPLDLRKPARDRHPLILNSYVRVAVRGHLLDGVARIPRTALHDGRYVWIASNDNKLDTREVEIVWGGADHVLVSAGLHDGERLISSDIGTPVQGMPVRTNHSSPASEEASAGSAP